MKRSKFLKIIGIASVAPVAVAKALEEWPEDKVVVKPKMNGIEEQVKKEFEERSIQFKQTPNKGRVFVVNDCLNSKNYNPNLFPELFKKYKNLKDLIL